MKEESRILEAEGIMPPEVKDMVQALPTKHFSDGRMNCKKW